MPRKPKDHAKTKATEATQAISRSVPGLMFDQLAAIEDVLTGFFAKPKPVRKPTAEPKQP